MLDWRTNSVLRWWIFSRKLTTYLLRLLLTISSYTDTVFLFHTHTIQFVYSIWWLTCFGQGVSKDINCLWRCVRVCVKERERDRWICINKRQHQNRRNELLMNDHSLFRFFLKHTHILTQTVWLYICERIFIQ